MSCIALYFSCLQVVAGNLLTEAVTWFFTSVLRGLQVHGQHEVCSSTLSQLAMLIYENLVRQILNISDIFTYLLFFSLPFRGLILLSLLINLLSIFCFDL